MALGEIGCIDEKGEKLGRFLQRSQYKDVGTLDFEEAVNLTPGLKGEMVVVGLALAWHRLYKLSMIVGAASVIF
jgi:hypothetical protein